MNEADRAKCKFEYLLDQDDLPDTWHVFRDKHLNPLMIDSECYETQREQYSTKIVTFKDGSIIRVDNPVGIGNKFAVILPEQPEGVPT
ncbi:MAG: hypothetical protein PHN75_17775 [Syntrophales bacterium]|nr:hypothetical protein [Syntrophales bacterium]